MVQYKYDAWGGIRTEVKDETHAGIAELNPFRYRSYYYDRETNLYYLNTRYYDPETGRFISQDDVSYLDPEHINGLNLFAYCGNNPVMRIDENGNAWWEFWKWNWAEIGKAIGAAVIAIAAVTAFVGLAIVTAGTSALLATACMTIAISVGVGAIVGGVVAGLNGTSVAAGILSGTVKGAAVGFAVGMGIMTGGGTFSAIGGFMAFVGAVGVNFLAGIVNYTIENGMNGREFNLGDAFASGGMQALFGMFAFGAGALLGVSGMYNIPGTTKMFSGQWIGNIVWVQFIKALFYYPFNWVFGTVQKTLFSGGR